MANMIPLSVPFITGNEWNYMKECLDTGWVSSVGAFVGRFEDQFAKYVGAKYAVATSNGTAALHVALLSLGLKPNEEVLVPTITFAASINAVHYCNARPVFFDCDESYNIDLDAVEKFIKQECSARNGALFNNSSGARVWGILPVHVYGNPVNMDRVLELSRAHGLFVVEDAAESLGSFWNEKHTGTFGQIGCFSFNGNKIVTTGGGGMVVTDSEEFAKKVRYLSTQAKDDPVRFIHDEIGYNYRLTNVQAAMGLAQLEALHTFLDQKQKIHVHYRDALAHARAFRICTAPEGHRVNHWLNNIVLSPESSLSALDLVKKLSDAGIETRPVWYPNHLQKSNQSCQAFEISRAENLVERTVSLPSSVGLTSSDQERVIKELLRITEG